MNAEETADFVWQHHYGKRWILYDDQCIRAINKAHKRNKKTLLLPNSNAKRKIIVNLELMSQQSQITLTVQKVRPVMFSNCFVSWMRKENGKISSYKPKIVFLLEVAYQRGENVLKYYDGEDYEINLTTFLETNESTRLMVDVVRETVEFSNMSREVFNIAQDTVLFRKMCSNTSLSFQTRCIVNLPSNSSLTARMSSVGQDIKLPIRSFSVSEEEEVATEGNYLSLPVDVQCPVKEEYHIYCNENDVFSVTLNLVNLHMNQNKFCIIQLLKHNNQNSYILLQRGGRIGTKGQCLIVQHGSNISTAVAEFEYIFYKKTRNKWIDRHNFIYISGQYNVLKIDTNPELQEIASVCQLHPAVKSLLELTCDKKTMSNILREMYYDTSCVPLGQLTTKQIKQGYIALSKIAEIISHNGTGSELVSACNEFYSCIPHNFGKNCPPIIQTKDDVEEKLKMLEALFNIRIAMKALHFDSGRTEVLEHPLTRFYEQLHCILSSLDSFSEEYSCIQLYLEATHGPTHLTYDLQIIDIFSCYPKGEQPTFSDKEGTFLLWHGSRITNWAGILKDGLKIAPPEAPISGAMFGKGLYFADVSSKSANYCFATHKENEGLLLLCEVYMGNMLHLIDCDQSLPRSLPHGYDSVFGRGSIIPSNFYHGILSSTAQIPNGPLRYDNSFNATLNYNEYVIYDTSRVKMKYLLRVRFKFK